jgi:hypothetical protein
VDEYYRLRAGQNRRLAEVQSAIDAQGEPFPEFRPFDSAARGTCRCIDKRMQLADCLYCVSSFIVSERAATVFRRLSLPEGMAFLPVDVVGKDGSKLAEMVCLMFPELVEALNLEASEYQRYIDGSPWYFTKPAVHVEKLKGLDLLLCSSILYVCSGRLKREIEKEELTNFKFEKMVVT